MIYCINCENECSNVAETCPRCGHPLKTKKTEAGNSAFSIQYPVQSVAVDMGSTKNAALYFDYVIPVVFEEPEYFINPVHPSILPPVRIFGEQFDELYDDINSFNMSVRLTSFARSFFEYWEGGRNELAAELDGLAKKYLLCRFPLTLPPHQSPVSGNPDGDTAIVLHDLRLVDTSAITWDEILEFRKDKESAKKLRRLRSFLFGEYNNMPRAFIEDDILQRLEDYNQAVRDWSFSTKTACLSTLLSSKTVIPAAAMAMATAFFDAPVAAVAASGLAVEIGGVAIEFAKQKYALDVLGRDHPLAYIIDAKKELER